MPAPALVVVHPSGTRSRVVLDTVPYLIGRNADNNLVLRDNRASRNHARIVREDDGGYFIEDLQSRHGVFVNGEPITRHRLATSDKIDFGFQDSYRLIFTVEDLELSRIMSQMSGPPASTGAAGNLGKLRALVEVARALQSSLSTNDVLTAVVDAALAVTSAERGFLLLRRDAELDVAVARDHNGLALGSTELRVPMSLINRALKARRDLLSMSFDPLEQEGVRPEMSVADLDLRSVVCVPLIRIRTGGSLETMMSSMNDTIGLLYMDSRRDAADMSAGNREILQTLALEASTILENARLLEQERKKQRLEQELDIARVIQSGLLPSELPTDGWFRAAGSSIASHAVGGDYFDVRAVRDDLYTVVIADVSGKGVSSALLASLLQGAFLLAAEGAIEIEQAMSRINHYMNERTRGEKYATVVYSTVERGGLLHWSNAGHPTPFVVRANAEPISLETTGMPLGLLGIAQFGVESVQLLPGDKVVFYSDGLSEAENSAGEFFDKKVLRDAIEANARGTCADLHNGLMAAVREFNEGSELTDDITLLVIEYAG
jgi:sigma-B regulation protein RsbU (phosphoserine phosphatase)